jgi:hypothetical protein
MPRDARLLSKYRVFISGVEIPHLGGNVTFGRNKYGTGVINVEPDPLVHDFRPNSKVEIFFFDRYGHGPPGAPESDDSGDEVDIEPTAGSGSPDDLLENYRLLFEGELIGLNHSKAPNSRMMGLSIGGEFRTFERSRMFQSSIGGSFTTPLITGGIAVPELLVDTGQGSADVLSLSALADNFLDGQSDSLKDERRYYRSSPKPDFAERMVAMTAFMASFSGPLRLQTVRSRLINKIAGVPDLTIERLMRLTLSNKIFQDAQGRIDGQATVLDLLNHICSNAFYSWYHLPGPYTPPNAAVPYVDPRDGRVTSVPGQPSGPEEVRLPENLTLKNPQGRGIFNLIRDYYRNDYVFLPELYFAMPPPCNFFFPDDSDTISYARTFDNEPTRFIVTEPYYSEGNAAYFAPPWLLRNLGAQQQNQAQSSDFFSANVAMFDGLKATGAEGGQPDYEVKSPYVSPLRTGTARGGINLLAVMTDDEIEKGIICSNTYHNMEFFSAISKATESRDEARRAANYMKTDGELRSSYEHFMTELAMYRFMMENARRQAQVTIKGHNWCVPGFSCAVFDSDSVYLGFIEQVGFSWDVGSNVESTSVGMSHVRHIPYQPPGGENQGRLASKRKGQEKVKQTFADARQAYINKLAEVGQALTKIRSAINLWLKTPGATFTNTSSSALTQYKEGVGALNRIGIVVAKSIYTDHTESAQRYVEARPNLPQYNSGISVAEIEEMGIRSYAATHLPMFPQFGTVSVPAIYSSRDSLPDMLYQAERLAADVQDYLKFQIEQLDKAQEEGDPPDLDPLRTISAAKVSTETSYSDPTTRQEIARMTGFFSPPSWFNQAFLRINTIDAIYQSLLGCQPFYSVFGETANPSSSELSEEEVYREYVRFLQAMDKVYPFLKLDGLIPSARSVGEKALWDRLSQEDELSPGPHWQLTRSIQHRDITTMGTFLSQNGLKLQTVVSSQPSPTTFYKMVPDNEAPHGKSSGDVQGYKFDNTIFSMIVDEWELFQRAGSTSDPAVTQLRETAREPSLTREYRQRLVEQYSKKHFGARGFDGR